MVDGVATLEESPRKVRPTKGETIESLEGGFFAHVPLISNTSVVGEAIEMLMSLSTAPLASALFAAIGELRITDSSNG
jgi:hypothetical protein